MKAMSRVARTGPRPLAPGPLAPAAYPARRPLPERYGRSQAGSARISPGSRPIRAGAVR